VAAAPLRDAARRARGIAPLPPKLRVVSVPHTPSGFRFVPPAEQSRTVMVTALKMRRFTGVVTGLVGPCRGPLEL